MRLISILLTLCALLLTAAPASAELSADRPTVLITGANRGLGLEFARQYAEQGWNVIATCRKPNRAVELQELADSNPQVEIERLDVTSDAHVRNLKRRYQDQPIDVLLNNAGVYGDLSSQTLGNFNFEELKYVLDVNAIGPLRMSEAFLDNVLASEQKKIISLGGGMGTQSIGRVFPGHYFAKMSKSAHLMAMGVLDKDVGEQGAVIVMISPGRVDTQMTKDSGWTGPVTPASTAASQVIAQIENLDPEAHGRLITWQGKVIPW